MFMVYLFLYVGCEKYDSITVDDTLANILINTKTINYKNHNRYKQYFLADKGYDSHNVRKNLKAKGYIPIIAHNKRNTKDVKKIKKLSKFEKIKYKKRIIVENYYGWLKMYPKMSCMYEKTAMSFENLVYFISSIILFNRI